MAKTIVAIKRTINYTTGALSALTLLSALLLSSPSVSADTSATNDISINVPISCNLFLTETTAHTATIEAGRYVSNIGESTITATCNDAEGFAIYAIGYTDNKLGKNVLTNTTLGATHDIVTGTNISGNTSNWAMKLSTITSPTPNYPIIIAGSTDDTLKQSGDPDFSNFTNVPDDYAKVAYKTSGTDAGTNAEGAILKTTYQAYIAPTQAAGAYTGQVKYTLVHPNNETAPLSTMMDVGFNVYTKMQDLVAEEELHNANYTSGIKAIKMADSLPVGFEATEANTVSVPESKYPIYIFFDDVDDVGTMYFYTEGDFVGMNPDSSYLLYYNENLVDVSGLAGWDASQVTNLSGFFADCYHLTNLTGLENWDVSNVNRMSGTFSNMIALTDISALSNWDTSNVTNMWGLFSEDGDLVNLSPLANWGTGKVELFNSAFSGLSVSDISPLANWDTSSATNMSFMFSGDTSLASVNLPNWDTGNVTTMSSMFANDTSITSIYIPNWDTGNVTDMSNMFRYNKSATSINVDNWDTSKVTNMKSMFNVGETNTGNGQLIEIIGLDDFNTSNVTDMTCMFYGAGKMTHYDIANWNVSKVESFNHMFTDNKMLESLDLSRWNVASVKTICNMFDDNYKLTTIGDVSHWNTANLIDAGGWLNNSSLFVGNNGTLDLSGWNTINLKSTNEMFRNTKLEVIDLTGWTFDSITNSKWSGAGSGIYYEYTTGMGIMFKETPYLNVVYLSQSGLNSFNAAVSRGVKTTDMWTDSAISGFTVKP